MSTLALDSEYTATGIPTGKVAIWWFLASEVAIFGGLIVTFVLYRFAHPEWSESAGHTINALGALNTLVLLTSSLTAVLAHAAASEGRGVLASRLLFATVGGGLLFLVVKAVEYSTEISHGFTPVSNLFWSFYFFMTGLHALHVVAGMVAMVVIARAAKRGENLQRVEYVGMYWHLVDIVWIFLFPLLYLAS